MTGITYQCDKLAKQCDWLLTRKFDWPRSRRVSGRLLSRAVHTGAETVRRTRKSDIPRIAELVSRGEKASALRHTFLTEAGECMDPFTLQYVVGHDNIETTMRYVLPAEAAVHNLFARLADLRQPQKKAPRTRSAKSGAIGNTSQG